MIVTDLAQKRSSMQSGGKGKGYGLQSRKASIQVIEQRFPNEGFYPRILPAILQFPSCALVHLEPKEILRISEDTLSLSLIRAISSSNIV